MISDYGECECSNINQQICTETSVFILEQIDQYVLLSLAKDKREEKDSSMSNYLNILFLHELFDRELKQHAMLILSPWADND